MQIASGNLFTGFTEPVDRASNQTRQHHRSDRRLPGQIGESEAPGSTIGFPSKDSDIPNFERVHKRPEKKQKGAR